MIKVKGQLGEMAKCLEDEDQRILLGYFSLSWRQKIMHNLSSGDNPVNEESFKKIMKFLFDFIEKDKHAENVVEKFMSKSERIIKKLLEGMSHYQDKLHENEVHKAFTDIITKILSHGRAIQEENKKLQPTLTNSNKDVTIYYRESKNIKDQVL
ncbi:hypothetical protein C2G38_2146410 [Gigaspora rosea]|uniref:Condensin complex subunit 1 C-terminal domain-containing protein n=1 Tax=Gigaspora rosea TaxID=44941 RepID=A0A397UKR4_9GLOM|nr:hypothetical protein C2G38_2146410 [Gigaspora rosea]